MFCEYHLFSSSSLLANVSVLSKLVKFLHHINPTRQYPACVLSTHIENATFAGKPARSNLFLNYWGIFLSFISRQDGTKLSQNWRRKKSPHSIKDVNLRLFIYIGKLLYTHKFTRSLSLPEYLVRQAKNAKSLLTSKINNSMFTNRVCRSCTGAGGHPPKSLDSGENFKPEHTLFCRGLKFVAIYALFGDLWAKKVPFWVKNSFTWTRNALLHGLYCIFYWIKFANLRLRTKTTHLLRKL